MVLLAGCGDPVGTPCVITGSGFTASHDCAHKCIYYWDVHCPDGSSIKPQQCSGRSDCDPGACPADQVCYHFEDPFDDRSYCLPATVCGDMTPDEKLGWERDSEQRAEQARGQMQEKRQRRTQTDSAPAQPPEADN